MFWAFGVVLLLAAPLELAVIVGLVMALRRSQKRVAGLESQVRQGIYALLFVDGAVSTCPECAHAAPGHAADCALSSVLTFSGLPPGEARDVARERLLGIAPKAYAASERPV